MLHSFRVAIAEARRHGDLYFAALVDRQSISEAFGEASSLWQGWIYTPAITVWVFLSQCLSPDHSCRDAVARLSAWRTAQGWKPCSPETGAYSTARDALSEEACRELVRRSGRELEARTPREWLWHGRPVRVVDGTTITMPDTPENQAEYPQARTQSPGCGLPIARVLVVFSLAVGTVIEAAMGPYAGKQTGENSLFRTLHKTLSAGDVVLADRYFSGWFDVALLRERDIDVVVHKHQLRPTDFRIGKRLGAGGPRRTALPATTARVAVGRRVCGVAGRVGIARGAGSREAAWLPHQDPGGRDDARRLRGVSRPRDRRALPSPLASGTPLAKPQGRAANGSPTLQDAPPCAKRVADTSLGVQRRPPRNGAGSSRRECSALANQL